MRRGARRVRVLGQAHGRGLQLLAGGEREPVRAAGPAGGGLGGVAAVHRAREDPVPEEAEDGGAQADDCGQGPEDCVLARQGVDEVLCWICFLKGVHSLSDDYVVLNLLP